MTREVATGDAVPLVACVGPVMVDVRVATSALIRGGDASGTVAIHPGGAAANVAVWARAAGGTARVIASRGDDLAGRLSLEALKARGIDLEPRDPAEGPTGAVLVVWDAGERSFVADPGANNALRPEDVLDGLRGADSVYISGYSLVRAGSRRAALAAAAAAAEHAGMALPAAVDAGSWPLLTGAAKAAVMDAAALTGTLLANADEAAALSGLSDPAEAGMALTRLIPVVTVKLGAKGVLVCSSDGVHAVEAEPAEVIDTTGAGDAFAAGFLLARCGGADPVEAARAGAALAARAVGIEGAWPPWPPVSAPAPTSPPARANSRAPITSPVSGNRARPDQRD